MIEFFKEDQECFCTADKKWGVIKNDDNILYLYREDSNDFLTFTGFKCETWEEVSKYIEDHE